MNVEKIPLIIDCDPGHDDALALIIALASEKLDVLAITPVAGNQTLDKTAENTRKILTFLDKRPPVARGAAKPLVRELKTAGDVHGETGLDGPTLSDADFDFAPETAWDLQRRLINSSPKPVTIAAVGPLTNIAILLTAFPEVKPKLERICIMGGGLDHGNTTPTAEFNIFVDPEAAHIVFSSGVPIVMCGLDVTEKAFVCPEEIEQLRKTGKRVAVLAAELMSFYMQYHLTLGFPGCHIHDPCAIAYLIAPEMFKTEDLFVTVETSGRYTTGMTVADRRFNPIGHLQTGGVNALIPNITKPNVTVCFDVDRIALFALLEKSCLAYG